MFRNQKMQRAIAGLVLITFTSLTMYPLTAAAQARDAMDKAGLLPKVKDEGFVGNVQRYIGKLAGGNGGDHPGNQQGQADERLGQLLNEVHEHLKAVAPQTALPKDARKDKNPQVSSAKAADTDIDDKVKRIRNKHGEIKNAYADIDRSFNDTEQRLKDAKLPPEILERHHNAVAQYQSRKAEFTRLMEKVEQSDSGNNKSERQAALADLGGFMAKYPNAKPHQYTDPNKLPFRTPDGKVRKPFETKEQYQASLFPPKYNKVMLAGSIPDGLQLAQATLPLIPAPQDTAETEDVQITPAIKSQASALNNDPVKIYNWVRNNIQFIPSYGSIQGSDLTLLNKRGNAFDTASLLIALYRAAGIPARYVYGTIEVPIDKVMNWVGGVTKPEAAQSLLGQGGIPNVALVAGGTVKAIRMEHVWVEAYVDYHPSRGAVNKSPNTWVPMDASFKQYQFTSGMDIKGNVPINPQTVLDQIKQGATVNEAEGWIQNLNQVNLQSQLTTYQNQVKTYVDSQKANATVGDVLGAQKIIEQNHAILLGTLPYKTIATGNTFQTLPDNLRWKFKTNIYAADGISVGSNPIIELNQSTAKLAGKKITLSFVPATQADQDLINSYMPKPHADGTPIRPSELPTSLPGYLLHMKAEFRVDGQVVAQTTDSFTMGSEVKQSNQYLNPARGTWDGGEDNGITVGEYNAIGIDLQGIGSQQVKNHQAKLDVTKAKLTQYQQNPNDTTPINGLTKEDLTGDIVQTGILSYFSQVDISDALSARAAGNIASYRLPSYGRFFTAAQTHYWFGIARNVSFPGVVMDVDYLFQHVEAKDADRATRTRYIRQIGTAGSSAEHAVPESMFRNPNLATNDPTQPQGVSAVKVLAIAATQGQKVYTLNLNNQALHGTILQGLQISQDVKSEIANALAAGKEVSVHEKDITLNGWTGSGYTILDSETGAGAYKIAGGTNGGFLKWVDSNSALLGLGAWALALAGGAWVFLAVAIVFAIVAAGIILYLDESDGSCGNGGLALYAALEVFFGIVGYYAKPIYAWIFWLLGMQADGGIRAALTHCKS